MSSTTAGLIEVIFPSHTLAVDVMGPFPASHGHRIITSVINCLSKFVVLVPTLSHYAAQALLSHIVSYVDVPTSIPSDRDVEITGSI